MTDPIIKEITVPIDPDRAFDLFTSEMTDWWPLEAHSLSALDTGTKALSVHVPSEVGAQVVETKPDGSQAPWGRVTEYVPGAAFAMSWHVGRAEEDATHVRVTFQRLGAGTQVRLVHDGWTALGPDAGPVSTQYQSGWAFVFCQRFGQAATEMVTSAQS